MSEKEPNVVKLAILEEKVVNMLEVISKLDTTIEKLSDLSVNVSKMLAVHEEKLEITRESAAQSAKDIALLEVKVDKNHDYAHESIRAVERRVWMGVGVALSAAILLQSGIVTSAMRGANQPAIIETKPHIK